MRRGPLAAGEKVQFTDRRSNKITDQLVPGGVTQTSHGIILHDDVIGQTEGSVVVTVSAKREAQVNQTHPERDANKPWKGTRAIGGWEFAVMRPRLADYVLSMPRGAQIMYPKDIAQVIQLGDIRSGMRVLESGAGSGAMSVNLLDAVGELVCTQPIPSMPLYLWGDDSGARYLASYFDMYPAGHGRQPGGGDGLAAMGAVWRHGVWIQIGTGAAAGCVIYGRSDATINRHGLRMGTSEIYSAVEALSEVIDSLVVDLEYLGRESYMPLFVVLREGIALDREMQTRINDAIEAGLSRRFLPNEIFAVAEIPRTLSGKKQELPIKKLLLGHPLEKVINKDAMANPGCLDWYLDFAAKHLQKNAGAA